MPAVASREAALGALLAERYGLALGKYPRTLIGSLLQALPQDLSRLGAADLQRIVSACSIGETMFLRSPEQLELLPRLVGTLSGPSEPLRLWSAGCATGEEAWSLAAVLRRTGRAHSVLGSDVNPWAIERARGGRYRQWSLRGVPSGATDGWLHPRGAEWLVAEALRPQVCFAVHNLFEDPYAVELDVVFCRNVLLYFHDRAAEAVYQRLATAVRLGGVLFIGAFDPEPPASAGWRPEELAGVRFFRRALEGAPRSPPPPAQPAPAAATRDEDDEDVPFRTALHAARGLSAQRAWDEALRLLEQLRAEAPLRAEPCVLAALVAEEAGRHADAIQHARKAYFLAPREPVTSAVLGIALVAAGERRVGATFLRQARDLLELYPDRDRPLPLGDELSANQLSRMIDAHLLD